MMPDNWDAVARELREQRDILIRLDEKMTPLVNELSDHEDRIRKLEERRFPLQTVSVILALVACMVAAATYVTLHL